MKNPALPQRPQTTRARLGLAPLGLEAIQAIYTVQADDHSSGDEHEIEYDIAAGV